MGFCQSAAQKSFTDKKLESEQNKRAALLIKNREDDLRTGALICSRTLEGRGRNEAGKMKTGRNLALFVCVQFFF